MFKYFLLILVILVIGILLTFLPNYSDQNLVFHQECLYPVITVGPTDNTSAGSGFVVQSVKFDEKKYLNVFITCAHVVRHKKDYEITQYAYQDRSTLKEMYIYNCKVYAANKERDLAVGVFISDEPVPCTKFSNEKLYYGYNIFRVGCGLFEAPRLDCGQVTGISGDKIKTNVFTVSGDSGSPFFKNNRVIGVTQSARFIDGRILNNISFFVPISSLAQWNDEETDALGFIWDSTKIPQMPVYTNKIFGKYEFCDKSNI